MSRRLILAAAGIAAVALAGCYDVAQIPPKPTPAEIVRDNAKVEIKREFAGKTDLKDNLGKFLEHLGEAKTTQELYDAWAKVYPDHPRVIRRAISKSLNDFYWPVAPVTDGAVYVEGFREAAVELRES
jgi:hypothetical protein